jgi:hypothetical protein
MSSNHLLSIADMSRITGKDFKTIKKRIGGVEPVKIQGTKHLYNAPEVLELIYIDKEYGELDLTKERAKLTQEQRKKTHLERKQMEGKLMDVEFVVLNYAKMATAIRAKLLSTPTKISKDLTNISSPLEIQQIIKEHINEVLTEISSAQFSSDIGVDVDHTLARLEAMQATG